MNRPVHTRTFKSGNSVAVRLPKGLGFAVDTEVEIEQRGKELVLRAAKDPAEEKAKLLRMLDRLASLPKVGEIEKREPIEFPDRPGLY